MAIFNTELIIEGISIDLNDNFDGSITYSIKNVQDISSITSAYSKTVTVPGSQRNNSAFNFLFNIKSSNDFSSGSLPNIGANYDFKRKAKCYVLQDQQVILQGYAQLLSATINNNLISYDLQISSYLAGLVSDLGSGRLEDLYSSGSSSPFDHTLTLKNITGSWLHSSSDAARDAGLPVLYGLIDYGSFDTCGGDNWYTQNLRPAMYAKQLFDLCMDSASYSYSSSFLSGSYFQGMVIPYKEGQISGLTTNLVNSACTTNQTQSVLITNTFNNTPVYIYDQDSPPYYVSKEFNPPQPARYDFSVNVNMNINLIAYYTGSQILTGFFNTAMNLYAYVPLYDAVTNNLMDGTHYSALTISESLFEFNIANYTANVNYTLNTSVFIPAGQYAKVGVTLASVNPGNTFMGGFNIANDKLYFQGTGSVTYEAAVGCFMTVGYDSQLDGNTLFFDQFVNKDVKQIDYVTSILSLFDLYAIPDKDQPKRLNIFTHDELYNSNSPILDWSNKIDTSQDQRITPIPSLNAQDLLFTYRPDSDYYNALYSSLYGGGNYGQLILNSGYQFNTDEDDILQNNIFSATPCVQYFNEYLPCEKTIEIMDSTPNTMQVTGYYSQISGSNPTASFNLSDNVFTKARIGTTISYWGNLYTIKKVINSSQFILDKNLTRPAGGINTTFMAEADTFSYLPNNNKIVPALYSSPDQNQTRQPTKVNPRILFYQGLQPCNNWTLQYTPTAPTASATSSYYATNYFVTQSVYPCVSHLDSYTNPSQDLLFDIPNGVFFNEPGIYPTVNLYTNFWENEALSIVDDDAKLLTAQFKLNSLDIANLDYSSKINVDGVYYRINAINNYSPDDSTTTEVELLRLPYQVYGNNITSSTPIITGSLPNVNISASLNIYATSTIVNLLVSSVSPVYSGTGSNVPLSVPGLGGVFITNSTGSQNLTVNLTSPSSSDVIYINDGFINYSQSLSSGSTSITIPKTFVANSFVYVSVSGSAPPPPVNTVDISNNRPGAVISSVTGISGFSIGSSLSSGQSALGTHSGFTGTIVVTFSSGPTSNSNLYLTGAQTQTIAVAAGFTGTKTFTSAIYASTDTIDITLAP